MKNLSLLCLFSIAILFLSCHSRKKILTSSSVKSSITGSTIDTLKKILTAKTIKADSQKTVRQNHIDTRSTEKIDIEFDLGDKGRVNELIDSVHRDTANIAANDKLNGLINAALQQSTKLRIHIERTQQSRDQSTTNEQKVSSEKIDSTKTESQYHKADSTKTNLANNNAESVETKSIFGWQWWLAAGVVFLLVGLYLVKRFIL